MFGAACAYVESVEVLDESVQLQLYGLYKQATVGTCTSARPSIFDWVGRAKHDAWSKLGDMHSTTAQNMYVQLVDRIDPMWRNAVRGGGVGGAVVSRFADMEEEEEEDGTSEMTDAAVRGNVKRVQEIIEVNKCAVDQQDVLGRTGLMMAADRGFFNVVEILLENNASVNLQDHEGNSALHYACICEHRDIAKLLIRHRAELDLKNRDGESSRSLCIENGMSDIL